MRLAPFPTATVAAPSGDPEVSDTGSRTWPSVMPRHKPNAQRQEREKSACNGRTAMGDQHQLLTMDKFGTISGCRGLAFGSGFWRGGLSWSRSAGSFAFRRPKSTELSTKAPGLGLCAISIRLDRITEAV